MDHSDLTPALTPIVRTPQRGHSVSGKKGEGLTFFGCVPVIPSDKPKPHSVVGKIVRTLEKGAKHEF